MIKHSFGISAAALLLAAGTAFAQSSVTTTTVPTAPVQQTTTTTTIQMTPQQEEQIYTTITKQQQVAVQPPPATWAPSVGVAVPETVQLYSVPTTIDVPAVRTERYTVVNGHVVLVNPETRQVTRIIER